MVVDNNLEGGIIGGGVIILKNEERRKVREVGSFVDEKNIWRNFVEKKQKLSDLGGRVKRRNIYSIMYMCVFSLGVRYCLWTCGTFFL